MIRLRRVEIPVNEKIIFSPLTKSLSKKKKNLGNIVIYWFYGLVLCEGKRNIMGMFKSKLFKTVML